MPQRRSTLRVSVAIAGRSALVVVVSILAVRLSADTQGAHWRSAILFSLALGAIWFCIDAVYTFLKLRSDVPAEEILDDLPSVTQHTKTRISGFVAMEYYALILNRTFVVFIAPDCLCGWKAIGLVAAGNNKYFEPLSEMLDDPELMHDPAAVLKLAKLKGGFVIPRSEIASVEVIPQHKWGMGGIPHSGRIKIHLASGSTREFILLGIVDCEFIKREILNP